MTDVDQLHADDLWARFERAERDLASCASFYEAGLLTEDQFRERVQIYRSARDTYTARTSKASPSSGQERS